MIPNQMTGTVGVVQGSETTVILNPPAKLLEVATKGSASLGRTCVSINGAPVYQGIFANGNTHVYDRAGGIHTVSMYAEAEEDDQVFALSMISVVAA